MGDDGATRAGLPVAAVVALGTNLGSARGDRRATLDAALASLGGLPGTRVLSRSRWYATAPVGVVDQPEFLNGACVLETTLEPRTLLRALLEVEVAFGRDRGAAPKWGPRTLDLDLILYGSSVIEEEGLLVPHPRMHERGFVLEPLVEIAHAVEIPTLGMTIAQAWDALRARHERVEEG